MTIKTHLFISIGFLLLSHTIMAQSTLSRQSLSIFDSATTSFQRTDSAWYYYTGGRSGAIKWPEAATSPDFYHFNDDLIQSDSTYHQNIFDTYPHSKAINTYDLSNRLTSTEVQVYLDAIDTWQKNSLTTYTYSSGNKTEELYQVWFVTTGWYDVSRKSFAYDIRNNLLSVLEEHKSGSVWKPFQKDDYTYDSLNRITSSTTQNADTLGVLVNSYRVLYNYSIDTNLTDKIMMNWADSAGTGVWRLSNRFCYEYNTTHKAVADTFYLYDNVGGWTKQYYENNSFDGAGNTIVTLRKRWNPSIFTFVNDRRYTWSYNTENQCTAAYSETWIQNTNTWFFYTSENAGHIDYIRRYYYGPLPASVDRTNVERLVDLTVYPSPASDFVTIKANFHEAAPYTLSIYDIQGRLALHYTEPAAKIMYKTISVNNLPAGIYNVRLVSDAVKAQASLIVTH